MVMPAEGPSLGMAPSGTCTCRSFTAKTSSLMPWARAWLRAQDSAAWADSFITSPRWPVRVRRPLPFMIEASTKSTSPPVAVQARPVAIPTASFLSRSSGSVFGAPRNLWRDPGVTRTVPVSPSATLRATLREIAAISRSKFRSPASRV